MLFTLTLSVVQTGCVHCRQSVFFFFYLFRVRQLHLSNLANHLTECICNNLTFTVLLHIFNVTVHYNFCHMRMVNTVKWNSLEVAVAEQFCKSSSFTTSWLVFEFQFRCFWCI